MNLLKIMNTQNKNNDYLPSSFFPNTTSPLSLRVEHASPPPKRIQVRKTVFHLLLYKLRHRQVIQSWSVGPGRSSARGSHS